MRSFVDHDSIVRRIWGDTNCVLVIFAGSAAEFAVNRAVDWLFFTNRLPSDPIGRFFSTVRYAQDIVFADEPTAERTIEHIAAAHQSVERRRHRAIPDWAYRDVLYMLIDYSQRAYELLYRPMCDDEQQELFAVFRRVGEGLRIPELPVTLGEWREDRVRHLNRDLVASRFTAILFEQYRRHIGAWRYELLRRVQALLVPEQVRKLLDLAPSPLLRSLIPLYGLVEWLELKSLLQFALVPAPYLESLRQFERTRAA